MFVHWFVRLIQLLGHLISQKRHIPMFPIEKTIFPVHRCTYVIDGFRIGLALPLSLSLPFSRWFSVWFYWCWLCSDRKRKFAFGNMELAKNTYVPWILWHTTAIWWWTKPNYTKNEEKKQSNVWIDRLFFLSFYLMCCTLSFHNQMCVCVCMCPSTGCHENTGKNFRNGQLNVR